MDFYSSDTIGGFPGLLEKVELRASSGRLFSYEMLCAIYRLLRRDNCPDWLLFYKKIVAGSVRH